MTFHLFPLYGIKNILGTLEYGNEGSAVWGTRGGGG
jgi:hypothetical protein